MAKKSNPDILYQDESVVLLDKPDGMLIHPNRYDKQSPTCIGFLAGKLGRRIYTVHRIDRATSGVVVFALDSETARGLAEQFKEHEVEKDYLALVRGHVHEEQTVDHPVRRNLHGSHADAQSYVEPISRTIVPEPVGRYDEAWYSLVWIHLLTGRSHQARKHLHHINHPIVGDKRHGDRAQNKYFLSRFGIEHLFLRAYRLRFRHPGLDRTMEAHAGLPALWRHVTDEIGLALPDELVWEQRVRFVDHGSEAANAGS
jgi:tRNA pseudouridine65 synthase